MEHENLIREFRKSFEISKVNDTKRHNNIEALLDFNVKLLSEMTQLEERCQQLTLAHDFERNERRHFESLAQKKGKPVKARRPFVVVLIDADADGYMFRECFLNKNEEGGQQAADELLNRVKDHLESLDMDVSNTDIVIRAYASFEGLARACVTKAGMRQTASLARFSHGFNGRRALFDFVDVGVGKERADHKIRELLIFFTNNAQCKCILLGIAHDSGYAPFLQEFATDKSIWRRLTLLEGYHVHKAIERLGFERRLKLTSVFAQESTPISQSLSAQASTTNSSTQPASKPYGGPFSLFDGIARLGPVYKNKKGIRYDKPLYVDKHVIDIVDKANLCPRLYLQGSCIGCDKKHGTAALGEQYLCALWSISRRSPCPTKYQKKMDCNDPKCIYGHDTELV